MFNFFRRAKNLWELSSYYPTSRKDEDGPHVVLIPEVPKRVKELAKIVFEDTRDVFEEPIESDMSNENPELSSTSKGK